MPKEYHDIMTPTWGRLVGGSTIKPQTKDAEGRPMVYKSGPNEGQPRQVFYIPVAINKGDAELTAKTDDKGNIIKPGILDEIQAAARDGFPNLFDANGVCTYNDFAFKVTDGDSTVKSKKGRAPCENEGYPGHWILNFSSDTQPQCYHNGRPCDPGDIKPGDYIKVAGSVCENGSTSNPGVFLNHDAIQLIRHGEEIKFKPDAAERFAAAAGDTTTTPDWVKTAAPATPGAVQPKPPVADAAPPMPPTPGAPPVPPAPAMHTPKMEKRYLYEGVQYTEDQLKAWPEEQLQALETGMVDVNDIPS